MPDGAVYVGRPTRWGNPWTGTTSGDKPGMSPAEPSSATDVTWPITPS